MAAMAMAMRDSVTVSMSDEMTGMLRRRFSASCGVELRVARENLRIKRRQRDVVEGQGELVVRGEKLIRRLVERIVEIRNCRVAAMSENAGVAGGFGKTISGFRSAAWSAAGPARQAASKGRIQPPFR